MIHFIKSLRSKIFIQLFLTTLGMVTISILVLFATNYNLKRKELLELRTEMSHELKVQNSSQEIDLLSPPDIAEKLQRYRWNSLLTFTLVSAGLGFGVSLLFYLIVGRHLMSLVSFNKLSDRRNLVRYQGTVPDNELGDLILFREELISEIEYCQKNIETKLNQAKSQLVQSAKMTLVGEMSSSIVHDLKNPLTTIIFNAEKSVKLLEKNPDSGKRTKEYIDKIVLSAEKINEFISRLNRFNRLSSQVFEIFDLAESIENVRILLDSKLRKNSIHLKIDIPGESIPLYGQQTKIEQVLMNLISNAIDASQGLDLRLISVEVHQSEDSINIEVKDNGKGVEADKIDSIFQPFFTTKDADKGTGLGLSICQQIVDEHQGQISVESSLGKGSTFSIYLPNKKKRISKVS